MIDTPRIKFDRAWRGYNDGESVVVTCTTCRLQWAALCLSQQQARRAGERHLEGTHSIAPYLASKARAKANERARTAATRR